MKRIPIFDATAPIACTLTTDEIPGRVALIDRMRDDLEQLVRTDDGLLLRFPVRPDLRADLERFTVDEKRCCEFWGFEVTETGGHVTLRWDGPPAAAPILDRLAAFFEGDAPALDLAGLL